jgi:DNA polymerase I-like protein with 3'-5' exonuclease and polymerase domains
MASDMTLLALVELQEPLREFRAFSVGAVHDALNFEVPIEEVPRVVPLIRKVMENLPLKKRFGVELTVPVVADVKIGTRWGSAEEVPAEVSRSRYHLEGWLRDHSPDLEVA